MVFGIKTESKGFAFRELTMPWNFGNGNVFPLGQWFGVALIPITIWSMFWTGLAMWHSARRGDKWWFIVFLLIHSAGILEIIYLLFIVHILKPAPSKPPPKVTRKR